MDGKKFIEIKKPVEEVREIETKSDEKQASKSNIIESVKGTIIPKVHASDGDDETKEAGKEMVGKIIEGGGIVDKKAGAIGAGVFKGAGKAIEGVGKLADNEDMKEVGEVYSEGAEKPLEDAKEGMEKVSDKVEEGVDKIKGIFD